VHFVALEACISCR